MISSNTRKQAQNVSNVFSCFSSRTRLLIVCFLIDGKKNVSEVIKHIGTTKGNISQHLKLLEDKGIVESEKIGNKVFYRIKDKRVEKLISYVKKLYCANIKF